MCTDTAQGRAVLGHMKPKYYLILFPILAVLLIVVAGLSFYRAAKPYDPPQQMQVQSFAITPQRLEIPSINVNAAVESVGLDSQKRMDVPKDPDDGAWYNLGYKPGEPGSAVISGHLDRTDGSRAVFYDLGNLQIGDKILVYGKDQMIVFQVMAIETYAWNRVPLQKIFNTKGKTMLNLITCQGTWNATTRNYSERIVVYSEFVRVE